MEELIPLIYRAVVRNREHQMYKTLSSDSSRGFYTKLPCDSPRFDDAPQGILLQNDGGGANQALRRRNVSAFKAEERVESNPSKSGEGNASYKGPQFHVLHRGF